MFVEQRSLKISAMLHFALVLIAAFGLPAILPDMEDPKPLVMTVDILPISEITNVKPSDKPIQEKKAPEKPQPKPVEPPKPKPIEKEEPKEKPFDPMEDAEPIEKKKEPEKKKEEPKKQQEKSFEDIMKDLNTEADKVEEKGKEKVAQEENKTISNSPYDETIPLGQTETDALTSAYIPCWSAPVGVKNAENLIVTVLAEYTLDGTLVDSKLDPKQQGKYNSDVIFRAAADAALRATRMPSCNPLRNLPNTLYPKLKHTKINFDPRLMAQ